MHAMSKLSVIAFLMVVHVGSHANPLVLGEFVVGLLGRSAVSRGVVSAAARSTAAEAATGSRMAMGRANRVAARGTDLRRMALTLAPSRDHVS